MHGSLRRIVAFGLVPVLSVLLSGCFLRSVTGHVIFVDNPFEEVDVIIGAVLSDATVSVCRTSSRFGRNCTYIVDGEEIASSVSLVSEFGIAGVLIDPVILQLPESTLSISATVNDGSGPRPAAVRSGLRSIPVQPGTTMVPEAGHQLVILELPAEVVSKLPTGDPSSGLALDYRLTFERRVPRGSPRAPERIKALFAGRVEVLGQTFYVPLLPCTSNFAEIPPVEIPESSQPVNLQSRLGDLVRTRPAGCNNARYNFTSVRPGATPTPTNTAGADYRTFLPLVARAHQGGW